MSRQSIQTNSFQPIGPYSHVTRIGNQIFVSGTPGVCPGTGKLGDSAYEQTKQALLNVISFVESAGVKEIDIASIQVNLVNVADFAEMNRAYEEVISKPYPARTVIGINALPKVGALLTINAVAVVE